MKRLLLPVLFLAFVAGLPHCAKATIVLDSKASAASTTSATTLSWSHTVGKGSGSILIVSIAFRADNEAGCSFCPGPSTIVTGVKFGSANFTGCLAARDDNATGSCNTAGSGSPVYLRSEIWYLLNPSPSTANIVVTVANATTIAGESTSYFGVLSAASGGVNASNNGQTGSSTATLSSVTVPSGGLLADSLAIARGAAPATVKGTNQTLLSSASDTATGSVAHINGSASQNTSTTATMSWSLTASSPWAEAGLVLTPEKPRRHVVVGMLLWDFLPFVSGND